MTESVYTPKRRLRLDPAVSRLMVITALIFLAFSLYLGQGFYGIQNLRSMAVQFPEFGILALAIMLAMITGGIDLSVVSIANLSAIAAALVLTRLGGDGGLPAGLLIPLAFVVALITGSLCGLVNGVLISRVGIPAILATLGTSSLYTGFSYVITGGPAITTTRLSFIGNQSPLGIPYPVIIFALLVVILWFVLNRTVFGFNLYMFGTNETAARFSGIDKVSLLTRTYWLAGVLGAVAGIVFLGRANSAKPDYGTTFVLLSVLICILGGVSFNGGAGSIGGVVLAILSVQFLRTGLNAIMPNIVGGSEAIYFANLAWGALLLGVMVLNYYSGQRAQRRRAPA